MRWTTAGLMAGTLLTPLAGCMSPERPQSYDITVRFTSPEDAAGKTEYESEQLRMKITEPTAEESSGPDMLAVLIVENKRDIFARIDAERSCLIDPNHGATNLLWKDAIIPPLCWTEIKGAAPGLINVYWNWPLFAFDRRPRPTGGKQRVLLRVLWDDGVSETVDLAYEVDVRNGPEPE